MTKILLIGLLFFLLSSPISQSQTNNCECQSIKPLLTVLSKRVGGEDVALSKLFQIGDECIDDLISNLNGNDFQMSVAAQEAIRYLGNEKGLKALDAWNKNNKKPYPVRGPVPIPLVEFDYEMIELNFLENDQRDLGLLTSQYLYALAIDKDSPKSKNLFQKLLKKLETVEKESTAKRMVDQLKNNYPLMPFSEAKTIEKTVLENAFFLSKEDKKFTTAKLLNFNGKKDKALVELHLFRGLLAEEWYHVVVRKVENAWEFFSITFIKQS
jgi:hypothetical protein